MIYTCAETCKKTGTIGTVPGGVQAPFKKSRIAFLFST
jgi:hypothetical protein